MQCVHVFDPLQQTFAAPLQQTFMWPQWISSYTWARHTCSAIAKELDAIEYRHGFHFVLFFLAPCSAIPLGHLSCSRDFNNSIHCKSTDQPHTSLTALVVVAGKWLSVVQYLSPVINPLFHITLQFLGYCPGYVGRSGVDSWSCVSHHMSGEPRPLHVAAREFQMQQKKMIPKSYMFYLG